MKFTFLSYDPIIFLSYQVGFAQEKSKNKIISVDFQKGKGEMNTMFKECIGAGRANEGLRADWQQQLLIIKKECDFKREIPIHENDVFLICLKKL